MNVNIASNNDETVMKLLYYFITNKGYNPIILHGTQNEIWLENQNGPYKIVRIVTEYIHNDEQFNYDIFKTTRIMNKIKHKTFNLSMNTLSIFLNLGDNVNNIINTKNIMCANIKEVKDLNKYNFVMESFPDILNNTKFSEKGTDLFIKLTSEIGKKSEEEAKKAEDVFRVKTPVITYLIILINFIALLITYIYGYNDVIYWGANERNSILNGDYYRLFTSMFLHGGIMHFLCNSYIIYVIGSQLESFFGKYKFLIIYLFSGIVGNLLSMLLTNGISVGASGAAFGLLGSIVYFGYHYRVYLGTVIKSQIIPLIAFNLLIGFMTPNIDNAAHIGGLIGGLLITMAVGVKYKSDSSERINGFILSSMFVIFLIYMNFFRV